MDPTDPKIVYAGTGESAGGPSTRSGAGILKSIDGGEHWNSLATGSKPNQFEFYRRSISRIIIEPDKPKVLYAAVSNIAGQSTSRAVGDEDSGIYKSENGGLTWTNLTFSKQDPRFNNELIGNNARVTDLEYTWNGKQFTLYAGVVSNSKRNDNQQMGGIWRSIDGGKTWDHIGYRRNGVTGNLDTRVPFEANDVSRIEFAVGRDLDGRDDGVLYAVVAKKDNTLAAVCRSSDGLNWGEIPWPGNFLGTQGDYSMGLAVDPKSHHLFVGGSNVRPDPAVSKLSGFIWELDPGKLHPDPANPKDFKGSSWTRIDNKDKQKLIGPHEDVQAMLVYQGKLYVATDGGLWRWDLTRKKWENLNGTGLSTSQLWSVAQDPKNPNWLLAGLQDNGIAAKAGDASWTTVEGGDGVRVGFSKAGTRFGALQNGVFLHGKWEDAFRVWFSAEKDYPFHTVFTTNPEGEQILVASETRVSEILEGKHVTNDPTDISGTQLSRAAPGNPITALDVHFTSSLPVASGTACRAVEGRGNAASTPIERLPRRVHVAVDGVTD